MKSETCLIVPLIKTARINAQEKDDRLFSSRKETQQLLALLISKTASDVQVAPSAGIEPATCGLEVRCSIRLSYEGIEYNSTEARRAEACVGTRVH